MRYFMLPMANKMIHALRIAESGSIISAVSNIALLAVLLLPSLLMPSISYCLIDQPKHYFSILRK
jgi:hypothetical protein